MRPQSFDEFIGQHKVTNQLKILVEAHKKNKETLGHILFEGGPGLGKTSLSQLLANELQTEIEITNAVNMSAVPLICPVLSRLKENSILFIDEIHRLPIKVQEFLYPVLEDYRIDMGKDDIISLNLPKFTLIGASTVSGDLAAPFKDRFTYKYNLVPYKIKELVLILKSNSTKKVTTDALELIAKRSRASARIAISNLKWVEQYCDAKSIKSINDKIILDSMEMLGIDEFGLNEQDRQYLLKLKSYGSPVGLSTLSNALAISRETIEENIEPFLLQKGLIKITSKGRVCI